MTAPSLLISIACVLVNCVASWAARPELGFEKEETLQRRLDRIILPKAEFKESPFSEALDFVLAEGRRLDPQFDHIKITMKVTGAAEEMVIQDGSGRKSSATSGKRPSPDAQGQVTVSVENESFLSVLSMVTRLAEFRYRIGADGLHIVPIGDVDPMFTRVFRIPADLYPIHDDEDRRNRAAMFAQLKKDPREFLIGEGIEFQAGAAAILADDGSRLTVHNGPSELYAVWRLLQPRSAQLPLKAGRNLARTAQMRKKMSETVLPRVDLQNVRLDKAVKSLEKAAGQDHPKGSEENRIRIQIKRRAQARAALYATDPLGGYNAPYVAGLDPEPKPVTYEVYPGMAVLPEVSLAASEIPFAEALKMIADQAEYLVFPAPDGATLVPVETVDVQYFWLPIPPGFYGKLEPVFTRFQDGEPVKKSWLGPRDHGVRYVQQSRIVSFAGTVGIAEVVEAIEAAWVEYFASETAKRRKAL